MTEHEMFHKWLGGESTEFIRWLVDKGVSESDARNFLYDLLNTVERRRGDYA